MSAAPRRLGRGLLLLLLPVLTIVAAEHHRAARGPFFFGPNQDPAYSYLMGSLQVALFGSTAFYHHPGLPGQGLGAAVLIAGHRLGGEHGDLTRDVLDRPERYLRAMQLTTLAALVAAMVAGGFWVQRRGGTVAALLIQASPFFAARALVSLSQVGPEAPLVLGTVALAVAVWHFAATAPKDERVLAIVFGVLAALAFTTRISALTFVVIPPLLLRTWRGRFFFAGAAAAATAAAAILIAEYWRFFLGWVLFLGERTGPWGSKQRDLLDPDLYADGLRFIFRQHHVFFATLALAGAVWLGHRLRRHPQTDPLPERGNRPPGGGQAERLPEGEQTKQLLRALGVVLLAQGLLALLVTKNPAGRYLVPATMLGGLDLALVWALLAGEGGRLRGRLRAVVAAVLLVLPAAFELPRHRTELGHLYRGVHGQRTIAAAIAELPWDCRVAQFFRASHLPFALHFGRRVKPGFLSEVLAELYPRELFYNFRARSFEDFSGPIPAAEVAREHPCLTLHGFPLPDLAPLTIQRAPMEVLYSVPSVDAVVASPAD